VILSSGGVARIANRGLRVRVAVCRGGDRRAARRRLPDRDGRSVRAGRYFKPAHADLVLGAAGLADRPPIYQSPDAVAALIEQTAVTMGAPFETAADIRAAAEQEVSKIVDRVEAMRQAGGLKQVNAQYKAYRLAQMAIVRARSAVDFIFEPDLGQDAGPRSVRVILYRPLSVFSTSPAFTLAINNLLTRRHSPLEKSFMKPVMYSDRQMTLQWMGGYSAILPPVSGFGPPIWTSSAYPTSTSIRTPPGSPGSRLLTPARMMLRILQRT
jgi:hypothetical protein